MLLADLKKSIFLVSISFCLIFSTGCGGDQVADNGLNYVRVRLAAEPDFLNPIISINAYSRMVFSQMYQSLMDFDPVTFQLRPVLATGPAVVESINSGPYAGGVSYSFEIRPEANWDDGRPITSEDISFSLKSYFHPGLAQAASGRSSLESFIDVIVDPANPKEITFVSKTTYILGEAAIATIPVLPAHIYDPDGVFKKIPLSDWSDPAKAAAMVAASPQLAAFAEKFMNSAGGRTPADLLGSGPYSLSQWVSGQKIVLKRKVNWWGDQVKPTVPGLHAFPDSLIYMVIPDQTTAFTALKAKELDVMSQIDTKSFVELREDEVFKSSFNLHTPGAFQVFYIGMNMKTPKMNDKNVRRAIALSIDLDAVIDQLFFGLAKRLSGPFHPDKPLYNKNLALLPYNPEQARTLLKNAGWEDTNGNGVVDKKINNQVVEMEFEYLYAAGSTLGQNIALLFQENAARSGIRINITPSEASIIKQKLDNRTFELVARGWSTEPVPDDPSQVWSTASDQPGGSNYFGFGNLESDSLIQQIIVTLDDTQRNKLYNRLQEIIYDEQPCIFLLAPLERIAISSRFKAITSPSRPNFFVNDFEIQE